MGFGWLLAIFWVLAAAAAVVYIAKLVARGKGSEGTGTSALDILKKRYAKGEISKEEFERMKDDLMKK
jgi:putative membrane protein